MRLRTNDIALVIKGRDRGQRGRVTKTLPKQNRAVVEGVNVATRHQKPMGAFRQGDIIQKEMPIPLANLMFYHETCDSPARISYGRLADGSKIRNCKNCGEVIE